MDPALPPDLSATLDRLLEGRSRKDLARRAEALSNAYRSGGGSDIITSDEDALAYALVRLPATYAAVAAVLDAVRQAAPGLEPASLMDVGAGPGTASLAAVTAFPTLADVDLLDRNPHLQKLAKTLLHAGDHAALRAARCDRVDAITSLPGRGGADLVMASYVAGEIQTERLAGFADLLWARTAQVLVMIEPGTPAGYQRIAAMRSRLIAAGARVIAPCPHDKPCPIVAPDWCHFVQRLARSREHRLVKGVELSYEDEKFAYVALARSELRREFDARVLSPPHVGKVEVTAKLCRHDGRIAIDTAARRHRDAYKARKGWRWGDAVTTETSGPDDTTS
ncbi:small ribosomal subunit Rsm22 family protein [Xanthobacteraceae bacterium Astr-EGSB]|uniref:small ribosomal subunit Rsm22 family protein n=1 Tax=Astrobacterium formosum TaxID=3069710 RepID=UPI0027B02179|nr:small ribosomal subunit Rsm22 family protein [Xanthobacteraceae bacterium Astr-EGSB]